MADYTNALAPQPQNSLWGAAKQYLQDALPGGALNREWTPERVETAKTALGFTPVVGDVLSGYDALQALRQGNYGEAALAGLGIIPFVPGSSVKGMVTAERIARERNWYGHHDKTSQGILTMMPPQRFLELAAEGGSDVTRRAEQMKRFDIEKYNQEFLPYLKLDRNKGQIVDHEGRARALRALMDKVPEIPVVIQSRGQRFKDVEEIPTILKKEHTGERRALTDVLPIELLLRQP